MLSLSLVLSHFTTIACIDCHANWRMCVHWKWLGLRIERKKTRVLNENKLHGRASETFKMYARKTKQISIVRKNDRFSRAWFANDYYFPQKKTVRHSYTQLHLFDRLHKTHQVGCLYLATCTKVRSVFIPRICRFALCLCILFFNFYCVLFSIRAPYKCVNYKQMWKPKKTEL